MTLKEDFATLSASVPLGLGIHLAVVFTVMFWFHCSHHISTEKTRTPARSVAGVLDVFKTPVAIRSPTWELQSAPRWRRDTTCGSAVIHPYG